MTSFFSSSCFVYLPSLLFARTHTHTHTRARALIRWLDDPTSLRFTLATHTTPHAPHTTAEACTDQHEAVPQGVIVEETHKLVNFRLADRATDGHLWRAMVIIAINAVLAAEGLGALDEAAAARVCVFPQGDMSILEAVYGLASTLRSVVFQTFSSSPADIRRLIFGRSDRVYFSKGSVVGGVLSFEGLSLLMIFVCCV